MRRLASGTRQKRGTLQPLVVATVQVTDERVLVERFMPAEIESLRESHAVDVYLDVRSVRNPASGFVERRYDEACPGR
jgi:hypothetical protein